MPGLWLLHVRLPFDPSMGATWWRVDMDPEEFVGFCVVAVYASFLGTLFAHDLFRRHALRRC